MLNFLVNNILDLSQMKQGKFRKDSHDFDLREVVNEVILIQMCQAKARRINLEAVYIGFSSDKSYLLCSDPKRIQ